MSPEISYGPVGERSAVWIREKDGYFDILVEERFVGPDLISRWNLIVHTKIGAEGVDLDDNIYGVVEPESRAPTEPIGGEYEY
jgi:hypothetical protein